MSGFGFRSAARGSRPAAAGPYWTSNIVLDESGDHGRLAELHADGHGEFAAGDDWQAIGGVAGQLRILGVEFQRQRRRVVDM